MSASLADREWPFGVRDANGCERKIWSPADATGERLRFFVVAVHAVAVAVAVAVARRARTTGL